MSAGQDKVAHQQLVLELQLIEKEKGFLLLYKHHFFCIAVEPPSAPRSIISQMNDSTLSLEWNEPLESGGRTDLSYSVRCTVCRAAGTPCLSCGDSVSYRPAQHGLVERRVEVWGLLPQATYIFTIQALNGVSQLSGREAASKSVNITTTHDGKRGGKGLSVF